MMADVEKRLVGDVKGLEKWLGGKAGKIGKYRFVLKYCIQHYGYWRHYSFAAWWYIGIFNATLIWKLKKNAVGK